MSIDDASYARFLCGLITLTAVGGWTPAVQAAYLVTVQPVGDSVVAVGSGSINLAGLTPRFTGNFATGIAPIVGRIIVGANQPALASEYRGTTTSGPWGGGSFTEPTGGSGSLVEVGMYEGIVSVPAGYVSGTPLGLSTATWADSNYSTLGLKPGKYVSTWGSGASADSFTVNVLVPEPSSGMIAVAAFELLAVRRRKQAQGGD